MAQSGNAIYIFQVRKPGQEETETVDIAAPDFVTAIKVMASVWPGVHIIKHLGIVPGGKRGTA